MHNAKLLTMNFMGGGGGGTATIPTSTPVVEMFQGDQDVKDEEMEILFSVRNQNSLPCPNLPVHWCQSCILSCSQWQALNICVPLKCVVTGCTRVCHVEFCLSYMYMYTAIEISTDLSLYKYYVQTIRCMPGNHHHATYLLCMVYAQCMHHRAWEHTLGSGQTIRCVPGPRCIKLTINGNFAFNGNYHGNKTL